MPRLSFALLLLLLVASRASAVAIDWTSIGNPGNSCDPQSQGCFGAVGYGYQIGTYEVTNAQYAEFLNAKAATDPLGLYNTRMGDPSPTTITGYGGITRSGSPGAYSYNAIAGREDMPVNYVSFYDALRFANWLNNGQGIGDTETGAYTLLGGTEVPSNSATVTRNAGAVVFVPTEDEWYKAAYYSASSGSFFDYPAGSDAPTTCGYPASAVPNTANCYGDGIIHDLTGAGAYTGSASPYGTFDQGGNVWEWSEAIIGSDRGIRGGSFAYFSDGLAASTRWGGPVDYSYEVGFRVASIPEPGTGLTVIAGLLGFGGWHRVRAG
jgi:formylglycine-generating enzyme